MTHLSITLTSLSYDGAVYLSYAATLIRSDNTANVYNYSGSVDMGQTGYPFWDGNNANVYQALAVDAYAAYCGHFSVSPDPVSYVFLGLGIAGPFVFTAPVPEFVPQISEE